MNQYHDLRATLIRIVERAAFLRERLSGPFVPIENPGAETLDQIEQRLEHWRQIAANGDPERFARRLAEDRLTLEMIRPALGDVRLKPGEPLPAWAGTLHAVFIAAEALAATEPAALDHALAPDSPLPFESIWQPFLQVAREQLRASAHKDLLAEQAQIALERSLLKALSQTGERVLHLEFMAYGFQAQPFRMVDAALPEKSSSDTPSTQLYRAFVHKLLNGGLVDLFLEYSVLARLLATITEYWVEATRAFLQHVAEDAADLQRLFAMDGDLTAPGYIADLRIDLSDPHHHRRSVIQVQFAGGLALIYKPRDLRIDQAYDSVLEWLNSQGVTPPLKRLKVLARPGHGWVEAVSARPCRDQAEARRYYRRAGILVALFYVLNSADFHCENLIACGEYPVPIDMEVLLSPEVAASPDASDSDVANQIAQRQISNSVLSSGLLPSWEAWNAQKSFDVSALGNIGRFRKSYTLQTWRDINTDAMRLVTEERQPDSAPPPNAAVLDGSALDPRDYLDDIIAGYQEVCRLFIERRALLAAPGGPLSAFKGLQIRFLLRATRIYFHLLNKALAPSCLRHGPDRSLVFDALSKGLTLEKSQSPCWPAVADECRALEQTDIPLFIIDTAACALYDAAGGVIEGVLRVPAYDIVISTLNRLNEPVIAQQIAFCRAAFHAWAADTTHRGNATLAAPPELADNLPALSPDQMIEEADRLAAEIERQAIVSGDTASWIALEYSARINRYQFRPLQYDLYSGGAGVALFFSALSAVTDERRYAALARQTLKSLLDNPLTRLSDCIGGAAGLGSLVYALVCVGRFLQDTSYWDTAATIVPLISPQHIAADTSFDVIHGAAGAILGLTALYRATGNEKSLENAITCGQHLLRNRTVSPAGYRAWATLNDRLLTGFSHGAAGIAYALLRLFEQTGDEVYREASAEAIAYEDAVFVAEAQNWPDFRIAEQPGCMTSWCHGAPGIALARLGGLHILDSAPIRQDIEVGVATTQCFRQNSWDFVCCGTMGRVETLLKAGVTLHNAAWIDTARRFASVLVARAAIAGSYTLNTPLPGAIQSFGFFQGLSGIGYEFLRLANPERVLSVLLWE